MSHYRVDLFAVPGSCAGKTLQTLQFFQIWNSIGTPHGTYNGPLLVPGTMPLLPSHPTCGVAHAFHELLFCTVVELMGEYYSQKCHSNGHTQTGVGVDLNFKGDLGSIQNVGVGDPTGARGILGSNWPIRR